MAKEIDKLKKLSPQERIKKLKELQKKQKKEIQEAQKLIKRAEEEAVIEEELKDIPIPQLKAVDIGGLFSPEERELFKAKRFITDKPKIEETEESLPVEEEKELEAIAEQAPRLTPEEEQQHIEYLNQLSKEPVEELYNRASELYNDFKAQGNMLTREQVEEFNNIEYANKKKFEAIQSGKYVEVSKEIAREMSLIEKMKHSMYQR